MAMRWAIVLVAFAFACSGAQKYNCNEVKQVLATADIDVMRAIKPTTMWWSYPRSITNEARIRRFLDGAIGANPGGAATYVVECHSTVCRLRVNERVAREGWQAALSSPDHHGTDPTRGTGFTLAERDALIREVTNIYSRGFYVVLVETARDIAEWRKPTRCKTLTRAYLRDIVETHEDEI